MCNSPAPAQLSDSPVSFGGATTRPSSTVRDLGAILDSQLSFGSHISQLASRCFYQLRSINSCVKSVVSSFVVSRIYYCNCLLVGCPRYQLDRLQAVMNTAARLIFHVGKYVSIKQLLRDRLHWLPVPKGIRFELCPLVFKAVSGSAPSYLLDLCYPVSTVVSKRRPRSAARGDLVIDTSISDFGQHSFSVAAEKVWNELSDSVRSIRAVDSFTSALKTFLFSS